MPSPAWKANAKIIWKDLKGLGKALLVLAGFVLVFKSFNAIDWHYFDGGTITDYIITCEPQNQQGKCTGTWYQSIRTTYSIHADQQIVIRQIEDDVPDRLMNCAIVDKNNWKCNSGSRDIGYTQGKIWNSIIGLIPNDETQRHVSRWEWTWTSEPPKKK